MSLFPNRRGLVPARLGVAIAASLLSMSSVLSAAPLGNAHTHVVPPGI